MQGRPYTLPWIGYLRVSTDEQDRSGLGLEAQEQRVRAMATVKDVALYDVVTEAASAKTLDRPVLQQALAAVKRGDVKGIIVAKLDRLTRSVRDLALLMEMEVPLISCAETVDTSTAQGRMILNITVTIAQWERETICERTRDALAAKKRRGEVLGNVPYGYRSEGGKLVPCETEQLVIAHISRWRKQKHSFTEIAMALNQSGFKTRRGTPWKYQYVQSIVKGMKDA